MKDPIKVALIIGAAIIVTVSVWTYFSPYQTCVRAAYGPDIKNPELECARALTED